MAEHEINAYCRDKFTQSDENYIKLLTEVGKVQTAITRLQTQKDDEIYIIRDTVQTCLKPLSDAVTKNSEMLNRHEVSLYGLSGKNGLVSTAEKMSEDISSLKKFNTKVVSIVLGFQAAVIALWFVTTHAHMISEILKKII